MFPNQLRAQLVLSAHMQLFALVLYMHGTQVTMHLLSSLFQPALQYCSTAAGQQVTALTVLHVFFWHLTGRPAGGALG